MRTAVWVSLGLLLASFAINSPTWAVERELAGVRLGDKALTLLSRPGFGEPTYIGPIGTISLPSPEPAGAARAGARAGPSGPGGARAGGARGERERVGGCALAGARAAACEAAGDGAWAVEPRRRHQGWALVLCRRRPTWALV